VAAIFTQEFYNAWLPDVVGAQIDRADKFLGIAADTFPTQHPMARITKSLFQATHCEVKGKEYNWENNQSLQRTGKVPPLNFALMTTKRKIQ